MKIVHVSLAALVVLSMAGAALADSHKATIESLLKNRKAPTRAAGKVAAPAQSLGVATKESYDVGAYAKMGGNHPSLGQATLVCRATTQNQFVVELNGNAKYESKNKMKDIQFDISKTFEINGDIVKKVDEKAKFSEDARKYQAKMLNMIALTHLVKFRAPSSHTGSQRYAIEGLQYRIEYGRESKWVKATLFDHVSNVRLAEFFLLPNGSGPAALDKFRVHTKNDKAKINFIRKGA